jgi:ABC-type lipoprotein release transport system permease subunit
LAESSAYQQVESSEGKALEHRKTFTLDLTPAQLLLPGLLAIAASTLATLLPARKASRLSPVEVIR